MSIQQDINNLITFGKIKEAIQVMSTHFPDFNNESILLLSSINDLEKKKMTNLITEEIFGVEKAKISMSIIQMINPEDTFEELNSGQSNKSKIFKVISQQIDFYKNTIKGFTHSRKILWMILVFISVIGITSIIFLQDLFPERFGQILMTFTVISFLSLIIGSLGFIGSQIQLFNNQKSFIKVQDHQ